MLINRKVRSNLSIRSQSQFMKTPVMDKHWAHNCDTCMTFNNSATLDAAAANQSRRFKQSLWLTKYFDNPSTLQKLPICTKQNLKLIITSTILFTETKALHQIERSDSKDILYSLFQHRIFHKELYTNLINSIYSSTQ